MTSHEERCAEVAKLQRIDDAFRAGDLEALRAALDDPSIVPNGPMPLAVGACLIYAVYHSPLTFIRTLLELGADPDVRRPVTRRARSRFTCAPAHDGILSIG